MTQVSGFHEKIVPKKKKTCYKYKNILRPTQCLRIVKEFLNNKIQKKDVLNQYKITSEKFDQWVSIFKNPVSTPLKLSHMTDNEKIKLVSCFLLGKLTSEELESFFLVDYDQIVS